MIRYPAGMWTQVGKQRWQLVQDWPGGDGSRNYVLANGDRVAELHVNDLGASIHHYVGKIETDSSPDKAKLQHIGSTERSDLAKCDEDQAWETLVAEVD